MLISGSCLGTFWYFGPQLLLQLINTLSTFLSFCFSFLQTQFMDAKPQTCFVTQVAKVEMFFNQ